MQPHIEKIDGMKLVGKRVSMSFADYRVEKLWKNFMPGRHQIGNRLYDNLVSLTVYPPEFFSNFQRHTRFEKWAGAEVSEFVGIPDGMETLEAPGGPYAVFPYRGMSGDPAPFRYIQDIWLPASGYVLDNRPHFEILGKNFRIGDPTSEEQIWIPVRVRE